MQETCLDLLCYESATLYLFLLTEAGDHCVERKVGLWKARVDQFGCI